ncbi:MAG TPA: helix-turn-helix domain-containing protein [Pyrinomonadaceae bacterium]|jgi:excisionase family DNA binding protein
MDKQQDSQIQQINTDSLLNEKQAATFLNISRMTLLRKRQSGEIKFFRIGFRVLYSKEKHLLPFLERCQNIAEGELFNKKSKEGK